MANFDGHDDIIDSREIIERIEEIESDATFIQDEEGEFTLALLDSDTREEYDALIALREDAESLADWHYGETLIHENYFTQAMRELCKDVGFIPHDLPGFIEHSIDWDGVADDLRADYTDFEFRGSTYWARS